jgi:DNA polymerase III subunit gamma/tau
MSAIYQQARPLHWDEVVGQEHVRDVLEAALKAGKLGHAYLFSGPRGVGKTTTARLIAMTANCESVGEVKPCGHCNSCLLVKSGSHPDVFEIDAASNNSVDDVRDLRDKVGLASMYGGKKVYILDEAHMMSKSAFNALLKTLEEPPAHVIFILATTEPERIIPTILSRCQHYRFRRLSDKEISGKLERLCTAANIAFEPAAMHLIGRLADGAMRDGESLLERMWAGEGAITLAAVEAALGLPPAQQMRTLARALLERNEQTVLTQANTLYGAGFAARSVLDGVKVALRQMLHTKVGLADLDDERDPAEAAPSKVPSSDLLHLLSALDQQDARFVRHSDAMALELALIAGMLSLDVSPNVSAQPSSQTAPTVSEIPADLLRRISTLEREISQLQANPRAQSAASPQATPQVAAPRAAAPAAQNTPNTQNTQPSSGPPATATGQWIDVLRLADAKTKAFLKPVQVQLTDWGLILRFDERSKFHGQQIWHKFDDLCELIQRAMGPLEIELITVEGSKKKALSAGERTGQRGQARVQGNPNKSESPAPIAPISEKNLEPISRPAPTAQSAAQSVAQPIPKLEPEDETAPKTRSSSARAAAFFEDGPRARTPAVQVGKQVGKIEKAEVEATPWQDPPPSEMPPPHDPYAAYDPYNQAEEMTLADFEAGYEYETPAKGPSITPLPAASWDALEADLAQPVQPREIPRAAPPKTPPKTTREAEPEATSLEPTKPSTPGLQNHPLYAELQRLFPSQIRSKGKLRGRDKNANNPDEAEEELPVGDAEPLEEND